MAGSQGPQTFAKRQRERAKQMERQRKFAEKLERNARKREAKRAREAGEPLPGALPEMLPEGGAGAQDGTPTAPAPDADAAPGKA